MSDPTRYPPAPEFSRLFQVARVSTDGEAFQFEANDAERAALARRFELIDLPSLKAEGRIIPSDHGRRAKVAGVVRAQVVQACVVTLEPVPAMVEDSFVRSYTSSPTDSEREAVVDLDSDDPPELMVGGAVDVGEAVAETLGLALDPYPRAPGAELAVSSQEDVEITPNVTKLAENERKSPFRALKGLLKKP
jgi:uncharacterized metal-binding protein YceD (DUF177 family)